MAAVIQWVIDHKVLELSVLLSISEILALIPSVKANSIFELIVGFLKKEQPPQAVV